MRRSQMANRVQMLGKKFGRLTVLARANDRFSKSGRAKVYWMCKCDCGNITEAQADCLRSGNTTSCGCASKEALAAKHVPLKPGTVYGELTIIEELPRDGRIFKYRCKCSCGKESVAAKPNLLNGHTTTCGHTKGVLRGENGAHLLYHVYTAMIGRATNPNHALTKNYLQRGVTIHPDWSNDTPEGFKNFFRWATTEGGWEPGLCLDKEAVDHNNLIYGPDTCRFVHSHVNAASARKKSGNNTSKYLGVYWQSRERDQAWVTRLMHKGEMRNIGHFNNELEAAKARDKYIRDNNLPHRLNFPNE